MLDPLHLLAQAAGLSRHWRDVDGRERRVADDALRSILGALGYPAGDAAQIARSLRLAEDHGRALPAMITGDVGQPIPLPPGTRHAALIVADGAALAMPVTDGCLPPLDEPGYYDLDLDGHAVRLAIAPAHCPMPAPGERRAWAAAVQIPALRRAGASAFGDFGDLAVAAEELARGGAAALAINPVHALFPGDGDDFSPYSPTSRQFLNTAMGDPALLGLPPLPGDAGPDLIDWPTALPARQAQLRALFDGLTSAQRTEIARTNAAEGEALYRHALFDALFCHFRRSGARGWQDWPAAYHDPQGAAVTRFAADHADEVQFHLFAQWLARAGLEQAQHRALAAGMTIGLIADLAVGVRPGGSDCWAMPQAMLRGLTIGAPPDPLGPLGQNWGITSFSPRGLKATGYAPFIAMLRTALRSAGALRIDHAFGLARLWVVPEGEHSSAGAYLAYPFDDLMRLITLEAHRAGALIIAEDLGTAPHGFTHAIAQRQMPGMRVLWFERAEDGGFIGAADYPALSVAMTGTHDTPTVAGWWAGRDLHWADRLHRLPTGTDRAQAEAIRAWDRGLLWSTFRGPEPRPEPADTAPVVDAALAHVARSPAMLAIAPVEDLLGEDEQPNLPGTLSGAIGGHPNWQRRLPAPIDRLLARPNVARRMAILNNGGK